MTGVAQVTSDQEGRILNFLFSPSTQIWTPSFAVGSINKLQLTRIKQSPPILQLPIKDTMSHMTHSYVTLRKEKALLNNYDIIKDKIYSYFRYYKMWENVPIRIQ